MTAWNMYDITIGLHLITRQDGSMEFMMLGQDEGESPRYVELSKSEAAYLLKVLKAKLDD